MLKICNALIVLGMLMSPAASAAVQVSIGIGVPHVSIGINLPAYPQLVRVPRCPPTSGSIQGTGIPGKWSSSASFNRSATSGRNRINGVISETSGIGGGIKISGGIGIANPS